VIVLPQLDEYSDTAWGAAGWPNTPSQRDLISPVAIPSPILTCDRTLLVGISLDQTRIGQPAHVSASVGLFLQPAGPVRQALSLAGCRTAWTISHARCASKFFCSPYVVVPPI
jgi:hypothetical protein